MPVSLVRKNVLDVFLTFFSIFFGGAGGFFEGFSTFSKAAGWVNEGFLAASENDPRRVF